MQALYRLVGFDPTKYKLRTELLAGLTTFLTMSYILAVNPDDVDNRPKGIIANPNCTTMAAMPVL